MNSKTLYYAGCIILFLALFWMFLPHTFHGTVEKTATGMNGDMPSHLINIFIGIIGVILGLILITTGNERNK